MKNIPVLTVKVFEFCAENYYHKNHREIDATINLDGLIASYEHIFEFTDAPVVRTIKEFKFDSITKKERGLFIVEFIGNGISSRAIIKKGRLILLENITVAGHALRILDENLNVCKG